MARNLRGTRAAFATVLVVAVAGRLAAQQPAPAAPSAFTTLTADRVRDAAEDDEEAESDELIETDRDSFTPATTTAGRRRLIVEPAYTFTDKRRGRDSHSFPELVVRYGIAERVELRFGWNYEIGGGTEATGQGSGAGRTRSARPEAAEGSERERASRISYGIKVGLTEQDALLPRSAAILQGFTPTGGPKTDTFFVGTLVFGWELPNRWQLDAATRYETASEEADRFGVWAPSVVLKVPIAERWNVHAEYFGAFSTGKAEGVNRQFFSPGVHYLVTPDLEVGVRVGWGLNDQSARFFANAGFGTRF